MSDNPPYATNERYLGWGLFFSLGLIFWLLDGIARYLGYHGFFGLFFVVCLMFFWSAMMALKEFMEVVYIE